MIKAQLVNSWWAQNAVVTVEPTPDIYAGLFGEYPVLSNNTFLFPIEAISVEEKWNNFDVDKKYLVVENVYVKVSTNTADIGVRASIAEILKETDSMVTVKYLSSIGTDPKHDEEARYKKISGHHRYFYEITE